MADFKLDPKDVPLIIRLIENPKYDIGLFTGTTALDAHDSLHILLGRGVLIKDEAFVIGFTMGSTGRLNAITERLFLLIARYLYPEGYKFKGEESRIFKEAAHLAKLMKCVDLSKVNYSNYMDRQLHYVRSELGIDINFLKYSYLKEKLLYPNSPESQRLVSNLDMLTQDTYEGGHY
jgi:hypothetical protein